MATRSDTPPEPVPAIDAPGQEAVVAAALAAPQIAEQLAALPDPAAPPAPAVEPLAATGNGAAAPGGSDDASVQVAALDATGHASSAPDLGPAMGAVPPAINDVTIGHITVTILQPDPGGSFAPSPLSFMSPSSSLQAGFGSLAPMQLAAVPLHVIPEDHNLIVPATHADAPVASAPTPEAHSAQPTIHIPGPAAAFADNDVFVSGSASTGFTGGGGAGLVISLATVNSHDVFAPLPPPPPHDVLLADPSPSGGSWIFREGSDTLVLAPGTHGTIGTGQNGYAIDLGVNGSIVITPNSSGPNDGPGHIPTPPNTGLTNIGTASGGGLVITTTNTLVPTGSVTVSNGVAAGYSVVDHAGHIILTPTDTHHG